MRAGRRASVTHALASIPEGARVFLGSSCGVPLGFVDAMAASAARWQRLDIVVGYLFEPLTLFAHAGNPFFFRSLHPTPALRGLPPDCVDLVPMRFGDYPCAVGPGGPSAPDVAVVQVTPPDRDGRCSLGVNVGSSIDAVRTAPIVIGQVNPRVPYTFGDGELHIGDFDYLVDIESELVEAPAGRTSDVAGRVGSFVASEIPAGATVHLGIGALSAAVFEALAEREPLGLHSGTFTAGCAALVDRGVLASRDGRSCVAAEVLGDRALFDWIDRNPKVRLAGAGFTHHVARISTIERFVAINSAVEVGLDGALNGETAGGRLLSAPGGLPDFVYGAFNSPGGRSIVALPATTATGSRIVHRVETVTLPPALADRVVTEHGVARLRGRSPRERVDELIAVAAPQWREGLRTSVAS